MVVLRDAFLLTATVTSFTLTHCHLKISCATKAFLLAAKQKRSKIFPTSGVFDVTKMSGALKAWIDVKNILFKCSSWNMSVCVGFLEKICIKLKTQNSRTADNGDWKCTFGRNIKSADFWFGCVEANDCNCIILIKKFSFTYWINIWMYLNLIKMHFKIYYSILPAFCVFISSKKQRTEGHW